MYSVREILSASRHNRAKGSENVSTPPSNYARLYNAASTGSHRCSPVSLATRQLFFHIMNDRGFYMYEGKGRKTEDILQVHNARHTFAVQKVCLFQSY